MPSVLRGFAHHQPVTPVIESVRGLLMGTPVGASPWLALAWCGGILAVSVALSSVLFRRRASCPGRWPWAPAGRRQARAGRSRH